MTLSTILIVEDMQEINDMIKNHLEKDNQSCIQAFSGSEAKLRLDKDNIDLVLLDLILPGIHGEDILKEVKQTKDIPVIVLSAKDSLDTRVEMLELGADDYICKPFELQEVVARVHVQLRKNKKEVYNTILKVKDLELHISTYLAFVQSYQISLTKHEFMILRLLMESPNQVFTKQAIYEYAWEDEYFGDERIINTHIGNLRANTLAYT